MAIITIAAADKISDSRGTINDNFALTPDATATETISGLWSFSNASGLKTDVILERTAATGVTIDGVKLKDSEPYCDVINEKTATAGVTIDGVVLKDSGITVAANIVMGDNSITGIDTLGFTDTAGTIAGIQNQNLVDKTAIESITGAWTFGTAAPTIDQVHLQGDTTSGKLELRGDSGASNDVVIWDTGIVDLEGQSAIRAGRDTSDQVIPHNSYTLVFFNAETYDIQSEFDSTSVTGTADATEASKLHDADGGFTAGLVGATVWNTTDNTYTTVSGFVDDGELDLTDDIMADAEGYVIAFSRFTATKAGKYFVTVQTNWASWIDNQKAGLQIKKNGTIQTDALTTFPHTTNQAHYASDIFDLAATDYLEVYVYQDTGSNKSLQKDDSGEPGRTYLSISKIA